MQIRLPTIVGNNLEAYLCHDPEVLVIGPAETGKTLSCLTKVHYLAHKHGGASMVIMRKTRSSAYSTVLETFKEHVLADDPSVTPYGGAMKPERYIYPNGTHVWIAGLYGSASDRQAAARILSANHDLIYVNQAEELTEEEWQTLTTRTTGRAGHVPYPQLIGDCNPTFPAHWIYSREAITRFYSWLEDNPSLWDGQDWTEQGVRTRERLSRLTGLLRTRLWLGQPAQAEGAIYSNFSPATHLIPSSDVPRCFRYVAGVDWGYTNAGAIAVFGIEGRGGRMYCVAQHYHTRQTDDWWLAQALDLQRQYHVEAWACDPSEPAYIAKFRSAGLNAIAGYNGVIPGITAVQQRLADSRLFIVRDSLLLRDEDLAVDRLPWAIEQEFPSYIWATHKEQPVKEHDHGLDAIRYAVCYVDNVSARPTQKVKAWRPQWN